MTKWDPTLSELARACTNAGHRPIEPADPGDVYRCAVDALEEAGDFVADSVSRAEYEKALENEYKEGKQAGKDEAEAEGDKAREDLEKQVEKLESDLLAARQDLAAAREVLGATDSSATRLKLWLLKQARIARESWADELCELALRLEHFATELDRPRTQKVRVSRGLRLNADDLRRRADNARAARIVCPAADEGEGQ